MLRELVRPGGRWSARAVAGVVAVVAGLVLVAGGSAYAASVDVPNGRADAGAVWGYPCDRVGATANSDRLVCVQGPRDDCPRWHSVGRHGSGDGWLRPSTPPCTSCSASPSVSPSASAAAVPSGSQVPSAVVSVPASASASPVAVVTGSLPVTGVAAGPAAGVGLVLVVFGVALMRPWHRRRPVG